MNQGDRERERRENQDQNRDGWIAAGVIGAAAALVGGLYWLTTRNSGQEGQETPQRLIAEQPSRQRQQETRQPQESNFSCSFFSNLLENMDLTNLGPIELNPLRVRDVPDNPVINNLDTLLADMYVRFIALRDDDFRLHYRVFDVIFQKLHTNMKKVDPYYNRYSSTVQIAGSHYDRLRIKKPDEFDVDIIIGMPLNYKVDHYNPDNSDIILEDISPGFVKLKMGAQFQRLPYRDEWPVNKTLFTWKDDSYYLLRSKFSHWFKSLVYRGLDEFEVNGNRRLVEVDGVQYNVGISEAGPAMTLKIVNILRGFKMDVDLVPALKFPENRWPDRGSYRPIRPPFSNEIFMVVPKPIKKAGNINDAAVSRSWRMSLIHQEKQLLYETYNLRQIIRYLKKLRDAQDMHHIASYYIKTLFLWEVFEREDPSFWRQAPSKLFIIMVKKFKDALEARNIPYFWNSNHNLIENIRGEILAGYASKLRRLVQILENPNHYVKVAEYLLTPSELSQYSDILQRIPTN